MHGAFDFHLQFTTDSTAFGIGNPIPDERAGGVPAEPAGMGDAGFNRGRNRTVTRNACFVEVIEEDYHVF